MTHRGLPVLSLLVVQSFNAVAAIAGGIGLIATNGLGSPLSWLDGSPFGSYLWPGVILLVVIGGTQAGAVLLLWRRRRLALAASAVAGFGLVIWIYVEVALLPGYSFLQTLFFATGMLQLVLVLLCLRVIPAGGATHPEAVRGVGR